MKDIKSGEVFDNNNIRVIRPGDGLPPQHYDDILGKIAKHEIAKGTPISWNVII